MLNNPLPTLARTLEEQNVVSALTLNIVRYTSWPVDAQMPAQETIDLCVIGDNVVQESFTSIDGKPVGNKTLQVINLSRLRNFEQCHVLFVTELKPNLLQQMLLEIKRKPLLTIGDSYEFAEQGGMVGLDNSNGKLTLYVNLPVVLESNFSISAKLLTLAKIIGN